MTTLRILLASAAAGQAAHWALYDAANACVATGCGPAPEWPLADRLEIVLAAGQVRLASVPLPPLAPDRVAAAAAFALEDQLAGPADDQLLAASPQRADGRVVVVVVARSLIEAIAARSVSGTLVRVVAEPELAAPGPDARWCAADDRGTGAGFVRLPDGRAFPVGPLQADGMPPPELLLALARGAPDGTALKQLGVDAAATDEQLARWTNDTGLRFIRGQPWCWHAAPVGAFAAATNLLQGRFARTPPSSPGGPARLFAPALWLAGAALALQVVATFGDWAWWRVDAWRTASAWRTVATAAGVAAIDANSPAAARSALARRYAQQRHARGLNAPDDALPLLARAAPALAGLPPGALKNAIYADGHWTLDLKPVDPAAIRDLDARLKQAGTPAIVATTAAGTRLRLGTN